MWRAGAAGCGRCRPGVDQECAQQIETIDLTAEDMPTTLAAQTRSRRPVDVDAAVMDEWDVLFHRTIKPEPEVAAAARKRTRRLRRQQGLVRSSSRLRTVVVAADKDSGTDPWARSRHVQADPPLGSDVQVSARAPDDVPRLQLRAASTAHRVPPNATAPYPRSTEGSRHNTFEVVASPPSLVEAGVSESRVAAMAVGGDKRVISDYDISNAESPHLRHGPWAEEGDERFLRP